MSQSVRERDANVLGHSSALHLIRTVTAMTILSSMTVTARVPKCENANARGHSSALQGPMHVSFIMTATAVWQ